MSEPDGATERNPKPNPSKTPAGPAWTISTLTFFYLVFPWLLQWHQNQTDRSLNRWIMILAVVQALVFFALSFAFGSVDSSWAFWASHASMGDRHRAARKPHPRHCA